MDASGTIALIGTILIIIILLFYRKFSNEEKTYESQYSEQKRPHVRKHTYTDYEEFFKENFDQEYQKSSYRPNKYDNLPQTVWGKDPIHQLGIPSTTLMRISVKSNAERKIADYFTKNKIKYEYEDEVRLGLFGRKLHPDFYLPEHDVYVEYWGLVNLSDEREKEKYVQTMKRKMAQYYSQGLKFVSIYPFDMEYLEYVFPRKFEKVTGARAHTHFFYVWINLID
jgi:hypothetical protein